MQQTQLMLLPYLAAEAGWSSLHLCSGDHAEHPHQPAQICHTCFALNALTLRATVYMEGPVIRHRKTLQCHCSRTFHCNLCDYHVVNTLQLDAKGQL